jgi:endogenous inhibitor of DNA gyrase (YacG/DUF329 family)
MDTQKQCVTCGKSIEGRVDRQFCSDKCRKYFKRHGEVGFSRIRRVKKSDLSGQSRTLTGGGGSSVNNYFVKRLIDLGQKVAENKLLPEEKKFNSSIKSKTIPLQIQSADTFSGIFPMLPSPKVLLNEKFEGFLGKKISYPFKMLIWGLPGSGKSTFSMQLADQISTNHKILYVAGEELLNSDTLKDKQNRSIQPRSKKNCIFINRLPNSETEWKTLLFEKSLQNTPQVKFKTVFYDSVTKLEITPFYVDAIANDCRMPFFNANLSHVFITHAHKDGQMYRGDGSWAHEVDIIIKCEKGVALTEKNRFGETGKVFQIY